MEEKIAEIRFVGDDKITEYKKGLEKTIKQ